MKHICGVVLISIHVCYCAHFAYASTSNFFPSTLFFTFVPHPSVSTRNILILVFALMLCIHFPMLVWALVLKLTIGLVHALIYKTRLRLTESGFESEGISSLFRMARTTAVETL